MTSPLRSYAVKVELAPTPEQKHALAGRCEDARMLWNKTLDRRDIEYDIAQAAGEKFKARRPDEILKAYPDHFHPGFPTALVRPVHEAADRAWKGFFKKTGGRPKFKSRVKSRWSFSYQVQGSADRPLGGVTTREIPVPKVGRVRVKEDPTARITGRVVSATVSRDVDRWWVSLTVIEAPMPDAPTRPALIVGVDLNTGVIACSDGRRFEIPASLKAVELKVRQAQHDLARYRDRRRRAGSSKDSNRYRAAQQYLGKLYRTMRFIRSNWLHSVTAELAHTCTVLVLEDLRVANMTRAAVGRNVAAKAGLNRVILNASFAEFRRQAEYKGAWYGCQTVVVDPAYTSRTCSKCQSVNEHPLKSYHTYVCESCGHTQDRDDNAAANIRFRGVTLRNSAGSTEGVERSSGLPAAVKRQRRSVSMAGARKTGDPPRNEDRAESNVARVAPEAVQQAAG